MEYYSTIKRVKSFHLQPGDLEGKMKIIQTENDKYCRIALISRI